MSPTVKLSLKAARALMAWDKSWPDSWALKDLEAAIAKATRSKARRTQARKPKAQKRAARNLETADIRILVCLRADDVCESCGCTVIGRLEMDHFFGRGKEPQSVSNCWLLCQPCHRAKTENKPDAAFWLLRFKEHCLKYGFDAEREKANARLAVVDAKAVLR